MPRLETRISLTLWNFSLELITVRQIKFSMFWVMLLIMITDWFVEFLGGVETLAEKRRKRSRDSDDSPERLQILSCRDELDDPDRRGFRKIPKIGVESEQRRGVSVRARRGFLRQRRCFGSVRVSNDAAFLPRKNIQKRRTPINENKIEIPNLFLS